MIRVGVTGALGKMGSCTCNAITDSTETELVYSISEESSDGILGSIQEVDPSKIDVIVDFTHYNSSKENIEWCIDNGVPIVVGTTGFSTEDLESYKKADSLVAIIPNFAIGAVLMMEFAKQSAKYFSTCEVIEYHHNYKKDAPSGTAKLTVTKILEGSTQWDQDPTEELDTSKSTPRGSDYKGVNVHSVRMNGMLAHQEVIFGDVGQTLTIKHDSYDRESFMPGVLPSVKKVIELSNKQEKGLILGLDAFL